MDSIYERDENKPHSIAICTPMEYHTRVLISQIVYWAKFNLNNLSRNGVAVEISMKDVGDEFIADENVRTKKIIDSIQTMSQYNPMEALKQSKSAPLEAVLLLIANDMYCGRVCFHDYGADNGKSSDAAIIIVESTDSYDFILRVLEDDSEKKLPIVFALRNKQVYANSDGAEKKLFEYFPNLKEKLKGREYLTVWYNPLGFDESGKERNVKDPSPFGIEEVFWKSVEFASSSRVKKDSASLERCQKIIELRNGRRQQSSIRRQLSLVRARKEYSGCAVRLYSSENLYALCKGTLSNAKPADTQE